MKGFQILRRLTFRIPALLAALSLWAAPSLLRADTSSATITQPTGAVTLYAGQTQLFAGTTDTGGTISWAFGDGGTASGAAVSHTYATAGSYTAVMTVTTTQQVCSLWNPDGSCSRYKNVTVTYTASRSITVRGKPTLSAFSASPSSVVSGTAVTLSWSVSGATALTLSPGGAVSGTSAVVHPTATTTYTLTASNPAGAATATATVTVTPLTVTLSPATARVAPGGQATFTATVSGGTSPSQAVTWSVVGSGAGSITAAGVYTAPSTPGTYTVKAVATQDGVSAGTATVTVPGWTLKLKKDIVYVGAKEVAEVDASGKTWVTFDDHLGSPRFQWDGAANPVEGTDLVRQKYAPFGEALMDPTAQAKFAKGFTGHEQTDPSGLIYMQARFYTPMYGRFLSPDPARDQHFEDTQSWNIYSYVRNSPTMQVDPTGMAASEDGQHAQSSSDGSPATAHNIDSFYAEIRKLDREYIQILKNMHGENWRAFIGESEGDGDSTETTNTGQAAEKNALTVADQPDKPAGVLTIYSSSGPSMGGNHSWITLTVGDEMHTYGTWSKGAGPEGGPGGLRVDQEANLPYPNVSSRTANLTASQLANVQQFIASIAAKGNAGWKLLSPCSTFARDAWRAGTGENLKNTFMGVSTPNQLAISIQKANGGLANGVLGARLNNNSFAYEISNRALSSAGSLYTSSF